MRVDLAEWLYSPDAVKMETKTSELVIRKQADLVSAGRYHDILDNVLERIADGIPLKTIMLESYPDIPATQYLKWIKSNPDRLKQYYDAQTLSAEGMIYETKDIADGRIDPSEETARSKLRIDTRFKIASFFDRDRFSPTSKLEVTNRIDLRSVLQEAENRIDTIDHQDHSSQ